MWVLIYCLPAQVRTTAPEKYRVKPSSSSCEPGSSVDIVVSLHGGITHKLCTLFTAAYVLKCWTREYSNTLHYYLPKVLAVTFFFFFCAWRAYFKRDERIVSPQNKPSDSWQCAEVLSDLQALMCQLRVKMCWTQLRISRLFQSCFFWLYFYISIYLFVLY